MGAKSKIQWTDDTDNVIVVAGPDGKQAGWYCQKVSPGCAHCYAERMNVNRFGNGMAYRVPADGNLPPLMLRRDILDRWARQTRPRRHFVSMVTPEGLPVIDVFCQILADGEYGSYETIRRSLTNDLPKSARMAVRKRARSGKNKQDQPVPAQAKLALDF